MELHIAGNHHSGSISVGGGTEVCITVRETLGFWQTMRTGPQLSQLPPWLRCVEVPEWCLLSESHSVLFSNIFGVNISSVALWPALWSPHFLCSPPPSHWPRRDGEAIQMGAEQGTVMMWLQWCWEMLPALSTCKPCCDLGPLKFHVIH